MERCNTALMRSTRRRRHEELAVHELVPRREERIVGDELAHLNRSPPTLIQCRHGHNVLGKENGTQVVTTYDAGGTPNVRHHTSAGRIHFRRNSIGAAFSR